MNINKFIANTTQEAIQMVKREMGSEAVILKTRTIRQPIEGGGKGEKKIEVTAAIDYEASLEKVPHEPHMDPDWVLERWRHMEKELKDLKETILSADAGTLLRPEIYFNDALRTRYVNFKTFGLRSEIIRELMHEVPEANGRVERSETKLLQDSLSRVLARINILGKGRQEEEGKIFSFIGPTGVGKTTTLAKLAAIKAIKQGRRAALITLDTFKIAAVAQLQSYARIMGIPLEVAISRSDLRKAIQRHRDCDLILIDTAGRSPNQEQAIAELEELFSIPEEIHGYLVLSATAQYKNLLHVDDRFGALPFKSYIFTKLDETEDASSMINFLISREKPVSYLATGQEVPEDIELASRKKLASLLLTKMREMAEHRINEVNVYGSGYRA